MLEKSFGIRLENEPYNDREGAYAVIFEHNGKVATIKTHKGNFLIGGGIEKGETQQECLKRECLEEIGFEIEIKKFICKSDEYCDIDLFGCYFHPIGYFYLVELKGKVQEPIETEHQFEWISMEEIEVKMYLKHQTWAIKQAAKLE